MHETETECPGIWHALARFSAISRTRLTACALLFIMFLSRQVNRNRVPARGVHLDCHSFSLSKLSGQVSRSITQ
jgi:hypothetical protein